MRIEEEEKGLRMSYTRGLFRASAPIRASVTFPSVLQRKKVLLDTRKFEGELEAFSSRMDVSN
jgi:hypothetical protein